APGAPYAGAGRDHRREGRRRRGPPHRARIRGPAAEGDRPRRGGRPHGPRRLRGGAHPGDRLHQPDRKGPARMSVSVTDRRIALPQVGPHRSTPMIAFGALLLRDVAVLRKTIGQFLIRTIMQPLLFVFVFTYVFPKIGQAVGGESGAATFSSLLVPG